MLKRNSITKIHSLSTTGQLIPFIIGVTTVARLVYKAPSDDYEPPELIWGFFVCGLAAFGDCVLMNVEVLR